VNLVLTSNSPGEVFSWVRVTVAALKRSNPALDVTLCLVPCPYASGAEKAVAEKLDGLARTLSPWETTRFLLGIGPAVFQPSSQGLVVFLGGDPWHALLLGRKLGYRTVGYFTRPTFWTRLFDVVAVSRDRGNWGKQAVRLVGDLMVDGVQSAGPQLEPVPRSRPVLALYPGSRRWHLKAGLGTFLGLLEVLHRRRPELDFVLVQSPFVTDQILDEVARQPFSLGMGTARARLIGDELVTGDGLRLLRVRGLPYEVMALFDLALTIPGTNTAELACASKPFVVPLHAGAFVGGGGLNGLIERLPVGNLVKSRLRRRKARRLGLIALPNQLAERMIAPELVLSNSFEPLLEVLGGMLDDQSGSEAMGRELRAAMGESGAADRLAAVIVEEMGS
jgi:hypothetical protein